jgi:hypothetical protein
MTNIKLRDGEVTLYHRTDSKNWQVEIRLPDGGRQTASLRTANEQIAKERAIKIHDEIYFRHRMGLSSQTVTFSEAADAWIKELRAAVRAGARKERTVIDYEPVAERYLKPFFGSRPIDCIKAADIAQYRSWRRDYWVTGPGSKEGEYEYDRNGQTIKRKMAHKAKAPSPQTINGENVVLRGIFKFACEREWMNLTQVPKVANVKLTKRETKERAYPPFAQHEYVQLRRFMTAWVKDDRIGERERWRREAIQDFFLIMYNSGLREHELFKRDEKSKVMRGLRWKDVEFFVSKGGTEMVELFVQGKTGSRHMVPLRTVRYVLERRKLRCPNAGPEDYVMALPDGSMFNTFDSGLAGVLTQAGLRKDPKTGRNRGIYSCRHSYATRQVQDDRNAQELAENMGTSTAMLNRSYYHFNARASADSLAGEPVRRKKQIG